MGKLSQLTLGSFRYADASAATKQTDRETAAIDEADTVTEDMQETEEAEENIIEQQRLAKSHYALDAEQLESLFPDLVYEQEDGTKAINYIEMIPLLVQSISELSAEVARLTGSGGNVRKAPEVGITATTAAVSRSMYAGATLRQNTPNPFTERTTIGFTLPDDARNAYVYIFDMQGKMQKQLPVDPPMQSVAINGYELQPGLYLYSLVIDGQEIDTKRMILSK